MRRLIASIAGLSLILTFLGCPKPAGQAKKQTKERSSLFPVKQKGMWGFMDKTGRVVVAPQFDDKPAPFRHSCSFVRRAGIPGVVSGTGAFLERKELVSIDVSGHEGFHDGMALVGSMGAYGYLDTSYAIAIQPGFVYAHDFSEGLAPVTLTREVQVEINPVEGTVRTIWKWGCIDTSGSLVIDTAFDFIGDFVGGLAPASMGGKCGYIRRTGRFAIDTIFHLAEPFSEGLAAVQPAGTERWGYIDTLGNLVVAARFTSAGVFQHGLAKVCLGGRYNMRTGTVEGGKWSLVNRSGEAVVEDADAGGGKSWARSCANGLIPVRINGLMGYADTTGVLVIPPAFEDALPFSEGLAAVRNAEGWVYIDTTGTRAFSERFDVAEPFTDGLAMVQVGAAFGYIDHAGQYVWQPSK